MAHYKRFIFRTLIFVIKLIKVNQLAEISRDIAQVFFASVFITSIFTENHSFTAAFWGLVLSVSFWITSLYLIEE